MPGSPGTPATAAMRFPTLGPTKRNLKSLSLSESGAGAAAAARLPRAAITTSQYPSVLLRIGDTHPADDGSEPYITLRLKERAGSHGQSAQGLLDDLWMWVARTSFPRSLLRTKSMCSRST